MVALIFLLLGVVFLLAAVGRIWIDATPSHSPTNDSAPGNNLGGPVTLNNISGDKDPVL